MWKVLTQDWSSSLYWQIEPGVVLAYIGYGSFQPNSNRGVHPMSWIFFLLIILVDIIETKKFCEFEISNPFRFRVVAIQNIGGSVQKVSREIKDPLKGAISVKLNPLKQ